MKLLTHCFPPVIILIAHKAKSEAKMKPSDIRQFMDCNPALFVTSSSIKSTYITAARQLVPKPMCETPVPVCTQMVGQIEVVFHESVARNQACMTAKDFIDTHLDYALT